MTVPVFCTRAEIQSNAHADLLALVLLAQRAGRGALPYFLGLQPLAFLWVREQHLPEVIVESSTALKRGELRQELLEMRREEWADLRDLLLANRAGAHPLEVAMADIVAAGCLGGDHLWRDLGLVSRGMLGELMQLFFPALAERNSADMKWKKFFYRQLCEQEGGFVCRSPSCEECAAYDDCFGPEH